MRVVITGGTSGIGYGTACLAAARGWEVTVIGRDRARGDRVASELGVKFIQTDLSNLSDTLRLADEIDGPVDALVLCAGVVSFGTKMSVTEEGYETTFATNYLSKFALTQTLLQQNKIGRDRCIVMTGGNGNHRNSPTDWTGRHSGMQAALKAALAVDLYASELAKRNPELRVHTCYPGMVRTNLFKEAPFPLPLLSRLFGKSIAKGSSYFYRLLSEKHAEVHWKQDRPLQFSPPLPSRRIVEALWSYSQSAITLP